MSTTATSAADRRSPLSPNLVDANNQFALDFYRHFASETSGPLFYSPFSIAAAWAMMHAGARGETAAEMAKVLHFAMPSEELHAAYKAALRQLISPPAANYELRIANRLWAREGSALFESFLKTTRDDYGAETVAVDFAGHGLEVCAMINAWVEEQTNHKIRNLVSPRHCNAATLLILVNAIYFKADWEKQFKKESTERQPFYLESGQSAELDLMHQTSHFQIAQTDSVQMLNIPYRTGDMLKENQPGSRMSSVRGNNLMMTILLPTAVDGLTPLERSLTTARLQELGRGMSMRKVRLWLPKFRMDKELDLIPALSVMGMPSAFSPRADFSGIEPNRELYVVAAIHKAFVEVDEKGTEAAAATMIALGRGLAPQEASVDFRADHPFLFLIRESHSGPILFMGRYTGPA
jgi:serine protease inhibitor